MQQTFRRRDTTHGRGMTRHAATPCFKLFLVVTPAPRVKKRTMTTRWGVAADRCAAGRLAWTLCASATSTPGGALPRSGIQHSRWRAQPALLVHLPSPLPHGRASVQPPSPLYTELAFGCTSSRTGMPARLAALTLRCRGSWYPPGMPRGKGRHTNLFICECVFQLQKQESRGALSARGGERQKRQRRTAMDGRAGGQTEAEGQRGREAEHAQTTWTSTHPTARTRPRALSANWRRRRSARRGTRA